MNHFLSTQTFAWLNVTLQLETTLNRRIEPQTWHFKRLQKNWSCCWEQQLEKKTCYSSATIVIKFPENNFGTRGCVTNNSGNGFLVFAGTFCWAQPTYLFMKSVEKYRFVVQYMNYYAFAICEIPDSISCNAKLQILLYKEWNEMLPHLFFFLEGLFRNIKIISILNGLYRI